MTEDNKRLVRAYFDAFRARDEAWWDANLASDSGWHDPGLDFMASDGALR